MRRIPHVIAVALGVLLLHGEVDAQALAPSRAGPVIRDFGPVYPVQNPDFATDMGPRRVVFEVAVGGPDTGGVNPRLETLARYLNMHAQAGVRPEDMELAVVVHGTAGQDLLGQEGYRARNGADNPNYELVQQLVGAGVDVILCGQTQMHRGLRRDQLAPGIQVALSAMTALVTLQGAGYELIPF